VALSQTIIQIGDLLVSKTTDVSLFINKIEESNGAYFFYGFMFKKEHDIQSKLWLRAKSDEDFTNILDAWTVVR